MLDVLSVFIVLFQVLKKSEEMCQQCKYRVKEYEVNGREDGNLNIKDDVGHIEESIFYVDGECRRTISNGLQENHEKNAVF